MKTMVSSTSLKDRSFAPSYACKNAAHGSALENLKNILMSISGKKPIFFLDYDGTLSPIVDVPDEAYMPESMREAVRKLSLQFTTAIVSGRGKRKVKDFVKLDNLFYAGSHGLDISGPKNSEVECKKFEVYMEEFKKGADYLNEKLKGISGAWVENNYLSLSVHYRSSKPSDVPVIEQIVDQFLLTDFGHNMKKSLGKMVFELKLATNWNKGAALLYILEALHLDQDEDAIPIYIGDDITDEDAFHAISELGRGISILVSEHPQSRPTFAHYWLRNTGEVQKFLENFVRAFDSDGSHSLI